MNLRFFVLALAVAALGAAGCAGNVVNGNTGSGGSGGSGGGDVVTSTGSGATCIVPSGGINLSFVTSTAPCSPDVVHVDGAFAPTNDGFSVGDTSISGVTPAIPQGTYVSLTYGCQPGFYGPSGGFVRIHNLGTLDGAVNATESGSRLWYFAAAEGAVGGDVIPFTIATTEVCQVGSFPNAIFGPEQVELSGPGFDTVAMPSSAATFTATSGDDAGTYVVKNINTQYQAAPGGDAWAIMNLTIERAD